MERGNGLNLLKPQCSGLGAFEAYIEMAEKLKELIPHGYSAAVYTQTTDVESEVNGLMTYDRKVIKLNENIIRKINQEICKLID